ncbi:MAG: aldehyde dehydrogenase family protein, partial [Gammaproteobacteria bacterium]|nr:aldehyde dehydrogenase family protein [Gammaproteobacteria bacterium]
MTLTLTRSFPVSSLVTSLIDGEPVVPKPKGVDIEVVNPTTEQPISRLREADAEEVGAAVRSARKAFDSGPWSRMDINQRKDILYSIRDHLRKNAEELAYLECLNSGLTLQSVRVHVERTARNFEFFAEVASNVHGETYTQTAGYLTYVTREPKGVAGCISPWNAPLTLSSMRVASCIAWGNTCVLKPSEFTPLSVRRMVEILYEAGLPPGV